MRRAKVINAEGEQQAAQKLVEAAELLGRQPQAMQLRYLQTLNDDRRREELDDRVSAADGPDRAILLPRPGGTGVTPAAAPGSRARPARAPPHWSRPSSSLDRPSHPT